MTIYHFQISATKLNNLPPAQITHIIKIRKV